MSKLYYCHTVYLFIKTYLPVSTTEKERYETIGYLRGFYMEDKWKQCLACKHDFFVQHVQCPLCRSSDCSLKKRLVAQCHIVRNEIERPARFFEFQTENCDVSNFPKQRLCSLYLVTLSEHSRSRTIFSLI